MTAAAVLVVGGIAAALVVIIARWLDGRFWARSLTAIRLTLPAGLKTESVANWLNTVAAATQAPRLALLPEPPIALEVVATRQGIDHILLVPRRLRPALLSGLRAALPGVRLTDDSQYFKNRPRITHAGELTMTHVRRPLASGRAEAASAGVLASLQPLDGDDTVVLQWIATSAGTPHAVSNAATRNAGSSGWPIDSQLTDSEAVRQARLKQADPILHVSGRLGVAASDDRSAHRLFGRVFSTVRVLNAPGVMVIRRWWLPSRIAARRLERICLPVTFWPLLVNTSEAVGLFALPVGEVALPGLTLGAARQLPPPVNMPTHGSRFGISNYPGTAKPLRLSPTDRLAHAHLLGPTGCGKSNLIAGLALQEIAEGHPVIVIDPKADLCTEILNRVPHNRTQDVIVLDPSATDRPVGFNILQAAHDEQSRELVVDHVIHIWHELYRDFWGPRSEDVLRAALLTLINARGPDGSAFTLIEVPDLLTNAAFRRAVLAQPTIPDGVRSFWAWYQALQVVERHKVIGPILNKLRAATLRSPIRLSLGQSRGLDVERVIRDRQILLVPLGKGTVGVETAQLLGTLLLSTIWQAILGRTRMPAAARHPVFVYLDEAQDVLRLPVDAADMLAQARGLGAGFTVAHQHLGQITDREVKAALLGTVRSTLVFQCGWEDANVLARSYGPHLTADDLQGLATFEFAFRPFVGGQTVTPVTGTTLPLAPATQNGQRIAVISRERHGAPRASVEAALRARLDSAKRDTHKGNKPSSAASPTIGRRRKPTDRGGPA